MSSTESGHRAPGSSARGAVRSRHPLRWQSSPTCCWGPRGGACRGQGGPGRRALEGPSPASPQRQTHTRCSGLENLGGPVSRSQDSSIRVECNTLSAVSSSPVCQDARPAAPGVPAQGCTTPRMAAQSRADGSADAQKTRNSQGLATGREGDHFPPSRSLSSPLPARPGQGAATHICGNGGSGGSVASRVGSRMWSLFPTTPCGPVGAPGQETPAADVVWPHPGTKHRVLAAVTCGGQGLGPGPACGATFPGLSFPSTQALQAMGCVRAGCPCGGRGTGRRAGHSGDSESHLERPT